MRLPFQLDPLGRLLNDVGLAGPVVASAILAVDALLTSILHRDLKRSLRLSAGLAWLYLVISTVRCFAPLHATDNELERVFKVFAAVALSLALAQTLFVLIVDFVLGRNGKKPLRTMIRYGLLGVTFLVAALAGLRAGVLVQYARPFEEGDVVQLADRRRGVVLGTNWRTTTVKTNDGIEHMVPN